MSEAAACLVKVQAVTLAAGVIAELQLPPSVTAEEVQCQISKALTSPTTDHHLVINNELFSGGQTLLEASGGSTDPVVITVVQTAGIHLAAVTGGTEGTLLLWDLDRGEVSKQLAGHDEEVTCVMVHWNSRRALSGSSDGHLRLWDLRSGSMIREMKDEAGITSLAVDWPTMRALSGGLNAKLCLWDLEYGETMQELVGHTQPVKCLFWDPLQDRALSGSADRTLRVWDTKSGQNVRELLGHMAPVNCVAADFKLEQAVSGSIAIVRLWYNIYSPAVMYRDIPGHEEQVVCLEVDFERELILSGAMDGSLRLRGNQGYHAYWGPGLDFRPACVAPMFSTRRVVAGGTNGALCVWGEKGDVDMQVQTKDGISCVALGGIDAVADKQSFLTQLEARATKPSAVILNLPGPEKGRREAFTIDVLPDEADAGTCRRTVRAVRQVLKDIYNVCYVEKIRFLRSGQSRPLLDKDTVPLPPMELCIDGPGSVIHMVLLALRPKQGKKGGRALAPNA